MSYFPAFEKFTLLKTDGYIFNWSGSSIRTRLIRIYEGGNLETPVISNGHVRTFRCIKRSLYALERIEKGKMERPCGLSSLSVGEIPFAGDTSSNLRQAGRKEGLPMGLPFFFYGEDRNLASTSSGVFSLAIPHWPFSSLGRPEISMSRAGMGSPPTPCSWAAA